MEMGGGEVGLGGSGGGGVSEMLSCWGWGWGRRVQFLRGGEVELVGGR